MSEMYRYRQIPVPAELVPLVLLLEVGEIRLRRALGDERGEGAISNAIIIVIVCVIAISIGVALYALRDRKVADINKQ